MSALRDVPAVSRDFSLGVLSKRMKVANFNSETNNCSGISKDKLSYFAYEFKEDRSLDG